MDGRETARTGMSTLASTIRDPAAMKEVQQMMKDPAVMMQVNQKKKIIIKEGGVERGK